METILERIVENRKRLILEEKKELSSEELRKSVEEKIASGYSVLPFLKAFNKEKPFLIAEIKKASPSKGLIRPDFDVAAIAAEYEASTFVNAISVLTEPDFFSGKYENLEITGAVASKPLLLKDFIIDEYQILRGFLSGASAFLLIASILTDDQIKGFKVIAEKLELSILFEIHSADEYKRALDLDMKIIGINNRDLKTFITDISNTVKIIDSEGKPDNVVIISESGIGKRDDIRILVSGGADGFLIGERFMREKMIEESIRELMQK